MMRARGGRNVTRRTVGLCVALLLASGAARAAEPEPNDDRVSAPSIAGGGNLVDFAPSGVVTVSGTLEYGDVDHFAFGVRAGEPLTLALFDEAGAGAFHDPLLVVYDGAGAEIARNDDGGPGFFARLALVPAADDEWTVAVTREPGATLTGPFGEAFDYLLVAAGNGPAAVLDAGGNDDDATAQPLPGPTVVVGELVPGDRDVFSLPVAEGELVAVSLFDGAAGEFSDSIVRVRRAGVPLAADDDAGPGRLSSRVRRVGPGEGGIWQIEVTGFPMRAIAPHQEQFDYQLVVATVADAPVTLLCDANDDGAVDRDDLDLIFAARGTPATGPGDPRDADGDGEITILDSRQCALRCDREGCGPAPPRPPSCGVGPELALLLAALGRRGRRRR
jgi:hypothetical protein